MGARQKLNEISIYSCVMVGAVVGLACGSWLVFIVTTGVLLRLRIDSGDIRLDIGKRKDRDSATSTRPVRRPSRARRPPRR